MTRKTSHDETNAVMDRDEQDAWRAALAPFHRDAIDDTLGSAVLVLMSPDDFLRLASPISSRIDSVGRSTTIRKAMDTMTPLAALPCLEFEIDETEAWVTRHDGRHRAMELRGRGFSLIPVWVECETGETGLRGIDAIHPQPHDEDEDYPGFDEDDLDARCTPIDASEIFVHTASPRDVRSLWGAAAVAA